MFGHSYLLRRYSRRSAPIASSQFHRAHTTKPITVVWALAICHVGAESPCFNKALTSLSWAFLVAHANAVLSCKSVTLRSPFLVSNKEAMSSKPPKKKTPAWSPVNTIMLPSTSKDCYPVGSPNRRSLQDMWAPNVSSSFSVSGVALSLTSPRACTVLPSDRKHI